MLRNDCRPTRPQLAFDFRTTIRTCIGIVNNPVNKSISLSSKNSVLVTATFAFVFCKPMIIRVFDMILSTAAIENAVINSIPLVLLATCVVNKI